MKERKVWVFFYGSFINRDVLKGAGFEPEEYEIARLNGYDIQIQPVVNIFKSDKSCICGIITVATHNELKQLFEKLSENYLPEAVIVYFQNGKWMPVLCYMANSMESRPATNEYIDRIVKPAKEYGFPQWYIEKIEKFRP